MIKLTLVIEISPIFVDDCPPYIASKREKHPAHNATDVPENTPHLHLGCRSPLETADGFSSADVKHALLYVTHAAKHADLHNERVRPVKPARAE